MKIHNPVVGFIKGLMVTIRSTLRHPVTAEYPAVEKRLALSNRYMGFPALTWDYDVEEPYCTGCMVCIRECPTQCMSAQMKDNPKHEKGLSRRRKIIESFEINLGRCILCGICVDVCNLDAIEMSHEYELSKYQRNANRVNLNELLDMGVAYQNKIGWTPKQPQKNSGIPVPPKQPKDSS
jgi:NADH-quinone oxidoreductase subunit I